MSIKFLKLTLSLSLSPAQLAGTVEYTDGISAGG